MITKGYYLTSKEWSFPEVLIDCFLEDIKHELTLSSVKNNIKLLEEYRDSSSDDVIIIVLGIKKRTLDIQGSDKATATIRGLEYVQYLFENPIKKK